MRKNTFLLTLLFCGLLTACTGRTEPETPPQTVPVITEPASIPDNPVTVSLYEMESPGTKELFYDHNWKFYVQDAEEYYGPDVQLRDQCYHQSEDGAAVLVCYNLNTGGGWEVAELPYGSQHIYWENVQLYPFTDILGRDGFIFEYPVGAAYEAFDFYEVNESGAMAFAHCDNAVYTADLDGDGRLELITNYHLMGYLDVFWTEGENNTVCSCSLNETARDYIGLIPGELVSLYLQEGDGQLEARWARTADGSSWKTRTLDLVSLWKWEKARTEFWDVLPFYTDDSHSVTIRLREGRSRPEDYPISRNYYRVNEIQVYDGDTLIQTILPDELTYDSGYLFEGFFVTHTFEKVPGIPDIRDFNFDGSEDLGLMAADSFPHNVPYCYFLWDPEEGQLSTDCFVLFSPLDIDEENQRLIEPLAQTDEKRYYRFDSSGKLVQIQ